MLLHARLAPERSRDDTGGVVVAVAGKVADFDGRIGQGLPDKRLD
jgi:hypothetical protein